MFLTLLIAYLLFTLAIMFFQRQLIYFPTRLNPNLAEIMAAKEGFVPWKNERGEGIGWKLSSSTAPTGSVLIFHGNAGCAIDRGYFAKPIHNAAAVDVFILEYPGYGARPGAPGEKSFLAAAEEAFALLDTNSPVYIVSESIGAGPAAHLANMHGENVAGLALFAPFNDFASLAQSKMPFLPVSLILWDRFDPTRWLENYSGPIKIVLAENDEIIPAKVGRKLHENLRGPKDLEVIPGARHNDIASQSAEWWKDVFSFWQTNQ